MNFNEDLTDPEKIDEEIKDWVSSAKKEIKIQSFQKGLIYNYDFFEDRPIKNAYSRLLWDLTPIISPKSIPRRSSSVSQAKSSMSTAVAMDYELMEYGIPDLSSTYIEIAPNEISPVRTSHQFCLRQRLGSLPSDQYLFKPYSRSKSY